MKWIRQISTLVCAAVVLLALFSSPATAEDNAPVYLLFEKSTVGDLKWEGTVEGGGIYGNLKSRLDDLKVTGPIWHVTFIWEIDAGDYSFTATLKGTLHTKTGRVVMNGPITEGYLLGAQVHEEGLLIDPDPEVLAFRGVIRIMPATAD